MITMTAAGRTLTSAWIETEAWFKLRSGRLVALSRVRGLKLSNSSYCLVINMSHSHECVD